MKQRQKKCKLSYSVICNKFENMDTIKNCIEKYQLLTLIQERVIKNKITRSTN